MDFPEHCAQLTEQTRQLAGLVEHADLTAPVTTCGEWTLEHLVRHVGGGHRWAEETVRTRAREPLPDDGLRDLAAYPPASGTALAGWLVDGAAALVTALHDAGPDAAVWSPVDPDGRASFYARRFAHEALVHRADAALATGTPFTAGAAVLTDAVDEWLELGCLPAVLDLFPARRALLGPGRTVHLHAHDGEDAEWVVDLTGQAPTWRRAHEKSAVAVRAPLTDLLLLVYRRRAVDGLDVLGDEALLRDWLDLSAFG